MRDRVGNVIDIRSHQQQRRKRNLEQNRSVIVLSISGVIHELDPAFCERFGYQPWDLVGANFSEIVVLGREFNTDLLGEMGAKRFIMKVRRIDGIFITVVGLARPSQEAKNLRILYLFPMLKNEKSIAVIIPFRSQRRL